MSVSTPTSQAQTSQRIAWQTRSGELATWAEKHLVNRTDRYGCYGTSGPFTASKEISTAILKNHFIGVSIVGLHSTSPGSTCRWLGIDIDNHKSDDARAAGNFDSAIHLLNSLTDLGIAAILEDSNGDGGYHIWILFSEPVATDQVYRFGSWLLADSEHELFPKQPVLTGKGLGNWLRLPGKHHTFEHWSRLYGDGEWLDYAESVELLLNAPTNPPTVLDCVPEPELPEPPQAAHKATTLPIVSGTDSESLVDIAERTIEGEPWKDLLEFHGWKLDGSNGAESTWTRPGKSNGTSATLNYAGNNLFHVFTTASDLPADGENGKSYGKWRFHLWSTGQQNDQVGAAKNYLPASIVEEHDRKWRESRNSGNFDGQQPKTGTPVDESGLKPYSNGAIVDKSKEGKIKTDSFDPFPLASLPSVLRQFVTESAQAIGCDPTFSVLPALAVCASSVGTSRCLMVKRGWYVPSLIWAVIVGESGSQKSPPMRMAVQPLKDRQKRHIADHSRDMADFVDQVFHFKRTQKKWERTGEGERPEAPEEPVMPRCIVQDSTIEALAPILLGNRRGVLLARDELSGWFGSFNQYSKGGGTADVPKWLEIYNTESITIDRKTGDQKFIYVPHPSVNICGGIQPDILSTCLTDERKADGLQSRLLMAYPPRQPKRWRDDEVSESTLDSYCKMIEDLSTLKPDIDSSGDERPTTLRLTDDARQLYKDFINHHGDEQNALHGHLASQWSKLEETPVRLAIILHCIRQVTDGVDDAFRVDAATMQAAITIGEWFKTETLRINRLLTLPSEVREAQHLTTWIRSRGGSITARDLYRLRRDIESIDEAEAKLIHLVKVNAGRWEDIHKSREFFLL